MVLVTQGLTLFFFPQGLAKKLLPLSPSLPPGTQKAHIFLFIQQVLLTQSRTKLGK